MQELAKYPAISKEVKALLDIIEDKNGLINNADEVESKAEEISRSLGKNIIQNWATNKSQKLAEDVVNNTPEYRKHIKKKSNGIQRLVKCK